MGTDALIHLEEIARVYSMGDISLRALDNVTLSIQEGEFLSIMGASGSGKSTLMNVMGCLDQPTSGQYFLDGREVSSLSRSQLAGIRNETLGFVFQSFNLLPRTSALENVELPMLYSQLPARERRRRALEALERVGLESRLHHTPNQLSGGQQQRVAIARALANRPRIILADEPTGNLDSKTTTEIIELFCALSNSGITLVLVTHEPDVASFASRIISMKDGRIASDVLHAPNTPLDLQGPKTKHLENYP